MLTVAKGRMDQSARGLAHSKISRVFLRPAMRESVLECAGPLALFFRAIRDARAAKSGP